MPTMLTPRQSKAARALLDWHQRDLAEAANIPLSTIKDFEASRHQLGAKGLSAIAKAYQKAGLILFFDDGVAGVGVRMKAPAE